MYQFFITIHECCDIYFFQPEDKLNEFSSIMYQREL